MSRNQLAEESSPYLLLHKDNPVHWRAWGPEALAQARDSNKPILLSIGSTACHWCHVMNRESFSDPAVAAVMNEHFINIKVDREERPDVDQVYQAAANLMGVQRGWPLTMFLLPNGAPIFASSYLPATETQVMPSFRSVLERVTNSFRDAPNDNARAGESITQQLVELWGRDMRGPLDAASLEQSAVQIGQRYDIFFGGLTGSPKFPNLTHVELLLRAFLRNGLMPFNILVQTTLSNISMGGLYDHLGGGIHHCCGDERWFFPHFEKLLCDNAQYIDTLLLAWQCDRNPLYRARMTETIEWLLRDMQVDQAFASSLDGDSEGEEGKHYLWTEAEVDAALAGTFAQKFKSIYNVANTRAYQGRMIFVRAGEQALFNANQADEALLAKQREMLLAIRNKRVAPMRDDKILADWNGMTIAALANAGAALRVTAWTVAAMRAFAFVEKALGDGDRLYHSWRDGRRQNIGFASDYAHMARAALVLWETTNDPRYLERAKAWVHELNEHFWDFQNGGYFFTSDEADPLLARIRSVYDQGMPNANGLMPSLLMKLYQVTQDPAYRDRANAQIEAFSGEVSRTFISMPTYLNSFETLISGLQIVVIGGLTNPKTHELMSAVTGRALPNKLLTRIDPDQSLPQSHPAFGKTMEGGRPTAYICQRNACSTPITNPVTLSQALQLPRAQPQQQPPMPQPVGRA